jgi:hypothetical protein
MKAQRGSRSIALLFLNLGARRGGLVNLTPSLLYPLEWEAVSTLEDVGGPQGRSGGVQKISPPARIRSPDRQARSEALHRPWKGESIRRKTCSNVTLCTGRSGDRIRVGVIISAPVQTSSGAHPASYIGTGRKAAPSVALTTHPRSAPRWKKEWLTLLLPLAFMVGYRLKCTLNCP